LDLIPDIWWSRGCRCRIHKWRRRTCSWNKYYSPSHIVRYLFSEFPMHSFLLYLCSRLFKPVIITRMPWTCFYFNYGSCHLSCSAIFVLIYPHRKIKMTRLWSRKVGKFKRKICSILDRNLRGVFLLPSWRIQHQRYDVFTLHQKIGNT
jgi:hypothetical protein